MSKSRREARMEQQVTFNWRHFYEETPDEGKPIMDDIINIEYRG